MRLRFLRKIIGTLALPSRTIVKKRPNTSIVFNKVFAIGFNKTGTTTMEAVFKKLGLNIPDQGDQQRTLVKTFHNGQFQPLKDFCDNYDAFQDSPFSQDDCYQHADVLFPRSKFVLTVRNPEKWFNSMCNFHMKAFNCKSLSELKDAIIKSKDETLYLEKGHTSMALS